MFKIITNELRKDLASANERIYSLNKELEAVNKELEAVKKSEQSYKDMVDKFVNRARFAAVAVDFASMDAFSIERVNDMVCGMPVTKTVIGYWGEAVEGGVKYKKAKEWQLYVADELHDKLVEQYLEKYEMIEKAKRKK